MTDRFIAETAKKGEGNDPLDLMLKFRASFDCDPVPHLQQITAPLLTVNFADDQINAPAFPALEELIAAVPHGRSVIVDAGDKSLGHQTLSKLDVWQHYVTELLIATERAR